MWVKRNSSISLPSWDPFGKQCPCIWHFSELTVFSHLITEVLTALNPSYRVTAALGIYWVSPPLPPFHTIMPCRGDAEERPQISTPFPTTPLNSGTSCGKLRFGSKSNISVRVFPQGKEAQGGDGQRHRSTLQLLQWHQ